MDFFSKLTRKIFLYGVGLLVTCIIAKPCTIGVASGKATSDGRPLLWKTRDYEVKPNIIYFTATDKYSFVSNITPAYGYYKSWYGLNEAGFAIVNSDIKDYPDGKNGPDNGEFIYKALKYCKTVRDFKNLLDSTNLTGRNTKAIFGVIDNVGGAAIFEVNPYKYWMFDANDSTVAPLGCIIRTNFTNSNGGIHGIERFRRSSEIINNLIKGDSLTVLNILKYEMRDMADSAGTPVTLPLIARTDKTPDYNLNCKYNICTPYSISATVIQGVKNNEPVFLTTMWAMLGNPFSSVAVPYWPVGSPPSVSGSGKGCPLFDISLKIKKLIFCYPNQKLVNINKTIKIRSQLLQIEDSVYNETNSKIMHWRSNYPVKEVLLSEENRSADYVYSKLKSLYLTFKN